MPLEGGGEGVELVCALDWCMRWLEKCLNVRGNLKVMDVEDIEVIGVLLTTG